jgi:uncharacterized protein
LYSPPKLGVGITYFPEIHDFIRENRDLIDVVEVEPQTHWYQLDTIPSASQYRINFDVQERIKNLPQKKIVHSVATPVGGKRSLKLSQFPYLRQTVSELGALWFSEHLSFNAASFKGREFETSFFLSPLQTYLGIKNCVDSIKTIANEIKLPFAIENGVNYLQSREDEISDGDFVSSVIERADCGLVLDLHNLWTNQVNGRQSIKDFLGSICRDRVWEIHLAGGTDREGYYIDAHRGEIPEKLIDLTKEIINYFPNLSALIFEVSPSYLKKINNDLSFIKEQLDILHVLWNLRNNHQHDNSSNLFNNNSIRHDISFTGYNPQPNNWEDIVASLVLELEGLENQYSNFGSDEEKKILRQLKRDPAIKLMNNMIFDVRASSIVTNMLFTSKLLLIHLGVDGFINLLKKFFREFTPSLSENIESKNFHKFLQDYKRIELLEETLSIDMAMLHYVVNRTPQRLVMSKNPSVLMESLLNYKLPSPAQDGAFVLEIGEKGIRTTVL